MLAKRWNVSKRDKKGMLWLTIYPFLLMLAGVGIQRAGSTTDPVAFVLSTALYDHAPFAFNEDSQGYGTALLDHDDWNGVYIYIYIYINLLTVNYQHLDNI